MRAALAAALLFSAAQAQAADPTAHDVAKQAGKTFETAGEYVSEKKDEFEKRAGSKIDELQKELVRLKNEAKTRAHQGKEQVEDQADHLLGDADQKGKVAQKKLGELKKSSGEAWHDLKTGVGKAVDDFADGVERARKK